MKEKIAVLGAGNGACAIAAHLCLQGNIVNLFEVPELGESFKPISEKREIVISGKAENGVAKLNRATTDIGEAVKDVDMIFISVPAFGYERMSQLLVPFLTPGQLVFFLPGCFATFVLLGQMKRQGVNHDITIAECVTLPYGARLKKRNEVKIEGTAILLPVGVFPAKRTESTVSRLQAYYPEIVGCENVLNAALNNLNPMVHPAPMVLSASSVQGREGFCLYRDALTEGVKRVMIASDKERIEVRKALGLSAPHYGYRTLDSFNVFEDFFGSGSLTEIAYQLEGPSSMKNRYVTEDVPYGLALYSVLGKKVGVKTPIIDSIIELAGAINGENYWETGENIRTAHLGEWDLDRLKRFLFSGAY
jgi:opine dehydrogenase